MSADADGDAPPRQREEGGSGPQAVGAAGCGTSMAHHGSLSSRAFRYLDWRAEELTVVCVLIIDIAISWQAR